MGFRECDALRDRSPLWRVGAENRERLRIALDHDFGTGLHTLREQLRSDYGETQIGLSVVTIVAADFIYTDVPTLGLRNA